GPYCEAAYRLDPREFESAFVVGLHALLSNKPQQADEYWKKILKDAYRRNVDDQLEEFLVLCALNKIKDAQQLFESNINSLANQPIGLLKEKIAIAASAPINRFPGFSAINKLLANVTVNTSKIGSGKAAGKMNGAQGANMPSKSLAR